MVVKMGQQRADEAAGAFQRLNFQQKNRGDCSPNKQQKIVWGSKSGALSGEIIPN
jgi:hypothetical protein